MKKTKFILFLALMLSIILIVGTEGCKGKKSKAVREEAPRALEEEPYDPCGEAAEEFE